MFKKGDFIIYGLIIAASLLLFTAVVPKGSSREAVVRKNNSVVARRALSEDGCITVGGNVIEIKDGCVCMKSADCKNQICVKHAPVSETGETVVCLPNGITVTVE